MYKMARAVVAIRQKPLMIGSDFWPECLMHIAVRCHADPTTQSSVHPELQQLLPRHLTWQVLYMRTTNAYVWR